MRIKKLWVTSVLVGACCLVVVTARAAELKIGSNRSSTRPSAGRGDENSSRATPLPANAEVRTVPLPPGLRVDRVIVGDPGSGSTAAVAEKLVYSNTLGTDILSLPGNNGILGDDLTSLVKDGCKLMRFKFRVIGRVEVLDPGGAYQIEYGLYDNCPNAGGPQSQIIPGTSGIRSFPANEDTVIKEIEHIIPVNSTVLFHPTVWLGIKTNRPNVGAIGGAPALVGFSGDRVDFTGFPCNADAGGFPLNPQASIYVEIYADAACVATFPSYRNLHGGHSGYQEGVRVCYADDLRLNVTPCNMIGYDVGVRLTNVNTGAWLMQLHADGGGLPSTFIQGTNRTFLPPEPGGPGSYVARFTFDPPISLPGNRVWFALQGNNAGTGWILTRSDAQVGSTVSSYARAKTDATNRRCNDGQNPPGGGMVANPQFESVDLPEAFMAHAGFDVTIHCAGEAPKGACCDMFLTDDGQCNRLTHACVAGEFNGQECFDNIDCKGDPKCRFIPQANCSFPPRNTNFKPAWQAGMPCRKCAGGANINQPCEVNANCPGSTCVPNNAFGGSTPCGVAACCRPDEGPCVNLSEKACAMLPPAYDPFKRDWQLGKYCGQDGQRCPRIACLGRQGVCTAARPKVCEGGARDGAVCGLIPDNKGGGDPECRSFCGNATCVGGPNAFDPCSFESECTPGHCRFKCQGGTDAGNVCTTDEECNRDAVCVFIDNGNSTCVGGPEDGERCTDNFQCPGGVCSKKHCVGVPGVDPKHGQPCEEPRDCREAICKGDPGCSNPICCTAVCAKEADIHGTTFCCDVHWDSVCAQFAQMISSDPDMEVAADCRVSPENEHCAPFDRSLGGATLVPLGGFVQASLDDAVHTPEDEPGYCCHTGFPPHCDSGLFMDQACEANTDCWDSECVRVCVGGINGIQCVGTRGCSNNGAACETNANCTGVAQCVDIECYDGISGVCGTPICTDRMVGMPPMPLACSAVGPVGDAECNSDRLCDPQTAMPGEGAAGTVWYRFEVPAGSNPISVRVNTCRSVNEGATDSLLQVFATLDSDAGICENFGRCANDDPCDVVQQDCDDEGDCTEDRQTCSIAGQDCPGDVTCVVDLAEHCENLLLIGCNDDAADGCAADGHADRPGNAKLCASNLEPGQTYFVELGAKSDATRGVYRLDLQVVSSCGTEGAENDACLGATEVGEGTFPFDLNAATFECPPPSCLPASQNDVWFRFTAPFSGIAVFDTCGGDPQPNTEMALYEGCDCPTVEAPPIPIACNGFAGGKCGEGSRIDRIAGELIGVTAGQCFLIRIGDRQGLGGSGVLNIDVMGADCQPNGIEDVCELDCDFPGCSGVVGCGTGTDCNHNGVLDDDLCEKGEVCCPNGPVSFTTPPNGVVDARLPLDPFNPGTPLGIHEVTVTAPPGSNRTQCWKLCETAEAGAANDIAEIDDNGGGSFTIHFNRPITPNACTTLTFLAGNGATLTGSYIAHTGNVNGSALANAQDVDALIGFLNNMSPAINAPFGLISADMNHSGAVNALDIFDLINGLNGAGPALNPATLNTPTPVCTSCLPTQ